MLQPFEPFGNIGDSWGAMQPVLPIALEGGEQRNCPRRERQQGQENGRGHMPHLDRSPGGQAKNGSAQHLQNGRGTPERLRECHLDPAQFDERLAEAMQRARLCRQALDQPERAQRL